MKVRNVFIFSVIMCVLFFLNGTWIYAHPQAYEHNKELEAVLFEEDYSKYQSDKIKNNVNALELASYLTIDQFGGKGEKTYDELREMNMSGLPWKFLTIDYSDIPGTDKKVNANTHRMYTHQGWDRNYTSKSKEADKFWKTRKKILLGTVSTIFKFDDKPLFGYGEKCNSLAGIIYYVHILGDYDEADKYTKISLLPDLAGRKNANSTDMDYDMITSLRGYIEVLFVDQKSSDKYKNLMKELDEIEKGAGKIVQSVGGVNTDEEFQEYHKYSNNILKSLKEYMPKLLKKEEFFSEVFYLDETK